MPTTDTTPRTCTAIRDEAPALHYALLEKSHAYARAVAEQNHIRSAEIMRTHRQTIPGGWERYRVASEPTTQSTSSATATHTPGPWRVAPACCYASGINIDAGTRGYVALGGEPGDATAAANARLIAAAPDLLAAMQLVHANAGESPEWIRARIAPIIAKAEGRA